MYKDAIGDRMKKYEAVSKSTLVSRMPIIIRLDGCHFHTFCKGFKKPFDSIMIKTMQDTMKYLCENIQGCVLGYTQSDEITLVLVDYKKHTSSAWFDNEVQKMVSVSASLATLAFNKFYVENIANLCESEEEFKKYAKKINTPYFDSRVFNVPREDVVNCILWRQLDAERNSILSVAQSLFNQKELQGLNLKTLKTKIEIDGGIIWGELPTTQKRGSCCIKDTNLKLPDGQLVKNNSYISYNGRSGQFYWDGDGYYLYASSFADSPNCRIYDPVGQKVEVKEVSKWIIDEDIPRFIDEGREYVEKLVFPYNEE